MSPPFPVSPEPAQGIATGKFALRPDSSVVERGPEKAGVGGSIPSLATTLESNTCSALWKAARELQEGGCYSSVMNALNVRSLQSKTQTISVYTRHTSSCSKADDPHWKRCNCVKYIYLLRDGKNKTISAKTRSWEKAEAQA